MQIAIITKEYPPYVYGGAGVHVDYLSKALARLDKQRHQINIYSFGNQKQQINNLKVYGIEGSYEFPAQDSRHKKVYNAILHNLLVCGCLKPPDIIHCHTWYTHFAGCLLKNMFNKPLVLTTHSLEPHRPWKKEQLGTGYHASTWLERTAYQNADGVIAVSNSMKRDVKNLYQVQSEKIRVIHNGIDVREYRPIYDRQVLINYGLEPTRPYILFVGRITRQKGIVHLVKAINYIKSKVQILLCAAEPDTEEIARDMKCRLDEARKNTENKTIWVSRPVPKPELIKLYSGAKAFICPSIYEPFGIVNLEAMACRTPVIATATGGIPEIVLHEKTGLLVPFEPRSSQNHEPKDPEALAKKLARCIDFIVENPDWQEYMAEQSFKRAKEYFSWEAIASQVIDFYYTLTKKLI